MTSTAAGQHGPYHQCECYGHDTDIPNYRRDISKPRTLQGHYAPNGGCPCPESGSGAAPSATAKTGSGLFCSSRGADVAARPKETFRAAEGPHTVHAATPATAPFINSRNYGGTVSQRGPTTLQTTAQLRVSRKAQAEARSEERAQDRKNFLKAVLRDEMLARMDAEGKRSALEEEMGLMGTHHVDEFQASQRAAGSTRALSPASRMASRGPEEVPTVGEQYDEIMDELEYVAGQPVGSKLNIIRLHYLVEEENRLSSLRRQERLHQMAAAASQRSTKK